MAADIKTFFRLWRIYAWMDLQWFLRDTRICLMYIVGDSAVSLSGVLGILLIAGRVAPAVDMANPELHFMVGCALLVEGLYMLFFMNNNAGAVSRVIGRGQLDHVLVQPVPVRVHLLANGIAPVTGTGPLLCGIAVTIWAAGRLPASPGPLWPLALLGLLLLSVAIEAAWMFAISAFAFRAPYAAEEIAPDVTGMFSSLAPYPLGGLAAGARLFLTCVLPVGSIAWLPASILLGKMDALPGAALLAGLTAGFVLAATLIFRKGLNYYAKYSCPRYSGFGR